MASLKRGIDGISYSIKGSCDKKGNKNFNLKEKRPKDWTAKERMQALIETGSMNVEEQTSWCRGKDLFIHNLEQWKKEAIFAMSSVSVP